MNQKKILLISAGIVAVLAGVLIILLLLGFNNNSSEVESYTIISEPSAPQSIQVTNECGTFTMIANGENESGETNWTINEYPDIPLSDTYCQQLANLSQNLSASKLFDAQQDVSSYGLDEPKSTIIVQFEDKSITITIGNQNPSMTGYYCQVSENPQIALLSNANASPFLRSSLDYVDRTLIPYSVSENESSADKVESCSITRSDLPETIVIQKGEDGSLQVVSPTGYTMDEDTKTLIETSPFSLSARTTAAVNPTEEQLASFGLTTPQTTVSYIIDGITYTLKIGNSASTSQSYDTETTSSTYYVMLEGRPVVYTMSDYSLPWLTMTFAQS